MAKSKETIFFCKECGSESTKWSGKCPACGQWNTMVEAPSVSGYAGNRRSGRSAAAQASDVATMSQISASYEERIPVRISEFDRVLGGGIVKGSLVLVGGDPGIGKSTILTQLCRELSCAGIDVLYVSGEESLQQIKMRADRLGKFNDHMKLLFETDLDAIKETIKTLTPKVCVIDSIQTMYCGENAGLPGSVSQIREATGILLEIAKGLGISIFVIGHVTKDGTVAGPRILEHMVDTVLYFEGDPQSSYRLLRSVKNRFGSTNEIGVFEMGRCGLTEVANPSEYMLADRPKDVSGSIVSCSCEGTRQILIEIQALTSKTAFGNPRRSATGIDYGRLNLLIAVLEKKAGIALSECDVYVNIVGGMKVCETALDLAIVLAIASSCMEIVLPQDCIAIGEVGLSGEVRNVSQIELRVNEAARMGFKTCIIPKTAAVNMKNIGNMKIIGVTSVREAIYQAKNLAK